MQIRLILMAGVIALAPIAASASDYHTPFTLFSGQRHKNPIVWNYVPLLNLWCLFSGSCGGSQHDETASAIRSQNSPEVVADNGGSSSIFSDPEPVANMPSGPVGAPAPLLGANIPGAIAVVGGALYWIQRRRNKRKL
jgi:hypothetical protein